MTEVILEGPHSPRLRHEQSLVIQAAGSWGWEVGYASVKQLQTRRIEVQAKQVPVGTIPFIQAALRQLGLSLPLPDCYPQSLHPFLHRTLTQASLRSVLARQAQGAPAVFVKPVTGLKRFTGLVVSNADEYRLATVSKSTIVWTAAVVDWKSEWRAYVVNHHVQYIAPYAGDASIIPDNRVVHEMVIQYEKAGAPAGYALDVGVLSSGETALVEVNDGFSLGGYGELPARIYADLLVARWRELTSTAS